MCTDRDWITGKLKLGTCLVKCSWAKIMWFRHATSARPYQRRTDSLAARIWADFRHTAITYDMAVYNSN
jgi:hypothetical protein